jgi:CRISP-associated protein Cas1
MDLYINTYGTYLHRRDDMFELEVEGKKTKIAPAKVRSIIISTGAFLTTDAVKLAVENNIDVVLMDDFGNPYGRFWHSRFGSTAFIRRRQIEVAETLDGLNFVKEWLKNKIDNSTKHLKELEYKRLSKADEIEERISEIEKYITKIDGIEGVIDEQRNTLQGYEGNASKLYFDILSYLIPEPYKFEGRSFRPAKDEFNCMLNYGFGVLYGKVEKAIVIAGLDPFVGIMHTDNYNKKSFVFDVIENYRHYVTKTVFSMFSRKKVNKSFFDEIRGGLKLNKDGKKELVLELSDFFDKESLYDGRRIKNIDIIQYDCHKVANKMIEK